MLTTEYFTPSRIVEILRNELQYIEMSMSDLKEKYHDPKKYKELSKKLNKYLKKLNQLKEQYPEEFI
jgi:cell shape-determining protein MreC